MSKKLLLFKKKNKNIFFFYTVCTVFLYTSKKTKNGPCFLFPVICRRIFFSEKKRNNQNKVALRKKLLFLHWLLLLYGRLRRSWFMFCSLHFTECQKYQPNPRKLVGNTWKEESVKSVQFSEIFYSYHSYL